ncbi:MAG: hypothetical protein PWP54_463 [Thermosipho sp. (in: thermotogales)]|nr:hypothetical protein [Thermosipho sp. (in: thermotogales)]
MKKDVKKTFLDYNIVTAGFKKSKFSRQNE